MPTEHTQAINSFGVSYEMPVAYTDGRMSGAFAFKEPALYHMGKNLPDWQETYFCNSKPVQPPLPTFIKYPVCHMPEICSGILRQLE